MSDDKHKAQTDARRLWIALVDERAHSEALARRIAQIEASRSWRITAPLRSLVTKVRSVTAPNGAWHPPSLQAPLAPSAKPMGYSASGIGWPTDLPTWIKQVLSPSSAFQPSWFIDVTEIALEDLGAGVQRVTRSLLTELLIAPPAGYAIKPVQLISGGAYVHARGFLARLLGLPSVLVGPDEPINPRPGDCFLGLDFCRDRAQELGRALRTLRQHRVHVSLLVHDVLPLAHPDWFPEGIASAYEEWLRILSELACQAICISSVSASELEHALRARQLARPPDGLRVVPLGANLPTGAHVSLPPRAPEIIRVLMVGTIEPRKGHAQVLDAIDQLWSEGQPFELMIVGRAGWKVETLISRLRRHPELGHRLHWIEGADDAMLAAIYRASDLLVMASHGEGYGLPVAEAGHMGVSLLLRDLPVFHEVAGDAADYFIGNTGADIAGALKRWHQTFDAKSPRQPQNGWSSWAHSARILESIALPASALGATAGQRMAVSNI